MSLLATLTACMIATGCTQTKYALPPLTENQLPQIKAPVRPDAPRFTPEEMRAIPRSAHGKILAYAAEWWGYADIMESGYQAYQDFLRTLFVKPK